MFFFLHVFNVRGYSDICVFLPILHFMTVMVVNYSSISFYTYFVGG